MKRRIAILLALVMAVALCACGSGGVSNGGRASYEAIAVSARIDEDGTAYMPSMDGETVVISGDVARAQLTADRKHAVAVSEEGELFFVDVATGEKTVLAKENGVLCQVRDKGVLYNVKADDAYVMHRYLFEDGSDTVIGEYSGYQPAATSLSVVVYMENKVYFLREDAQEKEKIGSYTEGAMVHLVTDDGSLILWSDLDSSTETVFAYENGENSRVCELKVKSFYGYLYSGAKAVMNKSGRYVTLMDKESETMYLKEVGGDVVKINLGGTPVLDYAYAASGWFSSDTSTNLEGLYVPVFVSGSADVNLYWVDCNGEREKVLSNLQNFRIANGTIYYIDGDDTLYYAKLNGSEMKDETKIATDVKTLVVPEVGGYVYYLKDYAKNAGTGTLYACKAGDKEPTKVASEVYFDSQYRFSIGADGKTVYYFKSVGEIKSTGVYAGDLYAYRYGGESTKLAGDVATGTLSSAIDSYEIMDNSLTYCKYDTVKDDKVYYKWVYYDGKEASTIASEVR